MLDYGELGELQPHHKEPINIIARRVKIMANMVEDFGALLDSEVGEVPAEPVHLVDMLRALQDDFQVSAQKAR